MVFQGIDFVCLLQLLLSRSWRDLGRQVRNEFTNDVLGIGRGYAYTECVVKFGFLDHGVDRSWVFLLIRDGPRFYDSKVDAP